MVNPLCPDVLGPGLEVSGQRSLAFTSHSGSHLPRSLGHCPSLAISSPRLSALLWFPSNLASFPARTSGDPWYLGQVDRQPSSAQRAATPGPEALCCPKQKSGHTI